MAERKPAKRGRKLSPGKGAFSIRGIDWKLLAIQKAILVDVRQVVAQIADKHAAVLAVVGGADAASDKKVMRDAITGIDGIVSLLDHIQDQGVDAFGESVVYTDP